jgi:rhomboid-related protein 1/2/3
MSYYHHGGLFQLGFFTYYSVSTGELNPAGPVPIDSIFIYRPDKRIEIWRFLLYMMLHAG